MGMKMHYYLITSERAARRYDERNVPFQSFIVYKLGQTIELDGLKWKITKVLE